MRTNTGSYNPDHYAHPSPIDQIETFPVLKMKELMDNLKHDIYPEAAEYLTGTESKQQRHLNEETLRKFRVGVGSERFYDETTQEYRNLPCIYFPMYAPLTGKQIKRRKNSISQKLKTMKVRESNLLKEAHREVEGR